MVVRYTLPNGVQVLGPPFTKAETRDMHRRLANGPRMVVHIVKDRPKTADPAADATSPHSPGTSQSAADAAVDPASPIGVISEKSK
jgi:hypothetical protein